jgi:hypothetical protein
LYALKTDWLDLPKKVLDLRPPGQRGHDLDLDERLGAEQRRDLDGGAGRGGSERERTRTSRIASSWDMSVRNVEIFTTFAKDALFASRIA